MITDLLVIFAYKDRSQAVVPIPGSGTWVDTEEIGGIVPTQFNTDFWRLNIYLSCKSFFVIM